MSSMDRDGVVLEQNRPRMIQVISPQTAYLMTCILQSVVEEGTGRKVDARTGGPATSSTRNTVFECFKERTLWVGLSGG